VVERWDTYVRSKAVNDKVAWYTKITKEGDDIIADDFSGDAPATGRRNGFYQGLRDLCDMAGGRRT